MKVIGLCGGSGSGISITPVAFLVVSPTGNVELLSVNSAPDTVDKIASLVDKAPDLAIRIKSVFTKKKEESENTEA